MKYYLDYAATTPLDSEVFDAMTPFLTEAFYNPSALYSGGVKVKQAIQEARETIASVISARSSEIVFVDGGSEANNLALLGAVHQWSEDNPELRPHIITTEIEHPSVLEVCSSLEKTCDVDYLSVNERGEIDIKELKDALKKNTVLVSIGYANGEIGTIQPIREVAKTIRYFRKQHLSSYPYLHSDAIQTATSLPLSVLSLGVDLLTLSGSKIYGPKKIASLYIKTGTKILPLMYGGDQEFGYRPGTENVSAIVGYSIALKKAQQQAETESIRLFELRNYFIEKLSLIPNMIVNSGKDEKSLSHIVNLTFSGISSEELVLRLDAKGIACSVKSACKSGEEGDSHVIIAIRKYDDSKKKETGSVRFSLGKSTTKESLDFVAKELEQIVEGMRATKEIYSL